MAVHVALLRAVNVGGTGKLPMAELRAVCEGVGFQRVRTYIQSGNVVLESRLGESKVKAALERALGAHVGKAVSVIVRSAKEMESVLRRNPFPDEPAKFVVAVFFDEEVPRRALDGLVAPDGESVQLSGREIFVHYPAGQGRSKLKLPILSKGTARNINTVAKLCEMVRDV
jgi:uncharacterized protein (DUF1697 family)